jgi:WD40 repeat protein
MKENYMKNAIMVLANLALLTSCISSQLSVKDIPGKVLSGHDQDVTSVAISADGKYVASGSLDNLVIVWN